MTTTKYLSCKETAVLVRQQLKACFPGQKFSVRSDTYSGGASIDVTWADGPTQAEVDAVVDRYAGSRFDGMQDLKYPREHTLVCLPGEQLPTLVHFGANFVFTHRKLSPAYEAQLHEAAAEVVKRQFGGDYDADRSLPEFHSPFCHVYPGNGHHLVWHLSMYVRPGQTLADAEAEFDAAQARS